MTNRCTGPAEAAAERYVRRLMINVRDVPEARRAAFCLRARRRRPVLPGEVGADAVAGARVISQPGLRCSRKTSNPRGVIENPA
jgi:hypothetical protein